MIGWVEVAPLTRSFFGIFSLYIKPAYRGSGFASRLLEHSLSVYPYRSAYISLSDPHLTQWCLRRNFAVITLRKLPKHLLVAVFLKRNLSIRNWIKMFKLKRKQSLVTLVLLRGL